MKKKILIVGNSAKEYALAKKMSEKFDVYTAPSNDTLKEFTTALDIRENSISELLEYVMENGIDFTIATSQIAIDAGIADLFNNNQQQIFAPSKAVSDLLFDKAGIKKIMYKLRIPTPKFGIFEKQNMAFDYVKNLKAPFVIKTNEPHSAVILTSQNSAKTIIDSVYASKNQKIIIEDYVYGIPFAFYTITDGYKALPIGSSILYKYSLDGDGGQLTSGMGACSPNYKLSIDNEYYLMGTIVYPLLEYLEMQGCPYIGVLGVEGILAEDGTIKVISFSSFMQDADCSGILNLIDTDIFSLFESCVIGSFSDETECIPLKERAATSIVLINKNRNNEYNSILGLDNIDSQVDFYPNVHKNKYIEYEADYGSTLVLTSFSGTITTAAERVYEDAKNIKFNGVSYRKDLFAINSKL